MYDNIMFGMADKVPTFKFPDFSFLVLTLSPNPGLNLACQIGLKYICIEREVPVWIQWFSSDPPYK